MNKKFLILDCNYLAHRAKYAMGGLSIDEIPTGVVYGFLRDIVAFTERFDTKHIIFCWDSKYSKRKEIYPQYKANRQKNELTEDEEKCEIEFRKQVKKLRRYYLKQIGFKNIFQQKGYESDDIIASVCQKLPKGDTGIIITADQDLYQCISPTVSMYDPRKRKMMTLQGFKKQYGILPYQWIRMKCLSGCNSDNIKGIKRVGEKTAIKYIRGEMNELSKIRDNIIAWAYNEQFMFKQMSLIRLPFEGTKIFKLRKDKLSESGWNSVCKKLGIKTAKYPFKDR